MISKTNHRIFNLQQRNTGLKNEIESIIIIKKKCQSFLRSSCYSYMSNNILIRIRYYECSDWNKTACSILKVRCRKKRSLSDSSCWKLVESVPNQTSYAALLNERKRITQI